MICEDPFTPGGGQAFPCGKCLPCLRRRARVWSHRILLEAQQWSDNAFVTLTYKDGELSYVGDLPTLVPRDLQLFLKRLRKAYPARIRFFGVGEYGDETWRPHYHVALFNFRSCHRGVTGFGAARPEWERCCESCRLVGEVWGKGKVLLGALEDASAQYVAGYVTKKLTHRQDFRLLGRDPEFARMSNRPGIGLSAMWEVADTFMKFNLDASQADVPVSLRHGRRNLPLGRYLRRKLREMIGKDPNTPEVVLQGIKEELRPVREAAFDASRSFKTAVQEAQKGEVARVHALSKIRKSRRGL